MIDVAYALIAIGGVLSLLNWSTLILSRRRKRFVSAVPLVGALPLGCGLALLPESRPFAWLALVADYGTLVVIMALPRIVYDAWCTSRINLLHCFAADERGRTVAIRLFRRRIAVISVAFDPPIPCNDHDARIRSFGLVGTWTPTETGFMIAGYDSDRQLLVEQDHGAYTTIELNYPSDKRYKYDCLHGLVVRKRK